MFIKHLERSLLAGLVYSELRGEEYILKGLMYHEEALKIYQTLFSGNRPIVADLFNKVGLAYGILGDEDKALEYCKQAYSIYSSLLKENDETTRQITTVIELFQPNFFEKQGLIKVLEEHDCLGGNKVGFECRWVIASRGGINDDLIKLKQKIQNNVLNMVTKAVDDRGNYGWSYIGMLGHDWGVKGYIEKGYLSKELGSLSSSENIEIAQCSVLNQ